MSPTSTMTSDLIFYLMKMCAFIMLAFTEFFIRSVQKRKQLKSRSPGVFFSEMQKKRFNKQMKRKIKDLKEKGLQSFKQNSVFSNMKYPITIQTHLTQYVKVFYIKTSFKRIFKDKWCTKSIKIHLLLRFSVIKG